MAVKQSSPSSVKKASELKRTLVSLIFLCMMGWLILVGWAFYLWVSQDFESAYQFIQQLYVKQSDLMSWPVNETTAPVLTNYGVNDSMLLILNDMQHHATLLWILIRAASLVMLTKLTMLITTIPLFFLSIMAGLIDGLNQRAIRAACLGRESTYVFHKTVPLARKSVCLALGLWLCVPVTLSPTPIFVGLAVMLGLVARVSASRFKKYL